VPLLRRRAVVEAIVALQVAYDYADALEERGQDASADPYARELLDAAATIAARMPAASAVRAAAQAAGERCARAQALGHAADAGDDAELRGWAARQAAGSALGWPEWLAGAQASVLSLHALIAASAEESTSPEQARALDRLYLSIGAVTMLDSLIDRGEDRDGGRSGYLRWYRGPSEMGKRLAATAQDAQRRSTQVPGGEHHRMVLAGIVAYYATAPQSRDPEVREVFDRVKAQLKEELALPLALLTAWRLGKRAARAAERIGRERRTRC
jgi:tetraprenyl-beta-curcumene synthase